MKRVRSREGVIVLVAATDRRVEALGKLHRFGDRAADDDADTTTSGALHNGSTVTSLTIGDLEIANLTTPFVMTLALPSVAYYSESDLYANLTYTLNCTRNGTLPPKNVYTTEELERAEYCGE